MREFVLLLETVKSQVVTPVIVRFSADSIVTVGIASKPFSSASMCIRIHACISGISGSTAHDALLPAGLAQQHDHQTM